MVLHERQFSNCCLGAIHAFGWALIFPCFWLLNVFLSLFIRTSDEVAATDEDPCYERYVILTFAIPILLAVFLVSSPFAILGLFFWIPVNHFRKPYRYSYKPAPSTGTYRDCKETINVVDIPSMTVCSTNVLLLPEATARLSNLSKTQSRARTIGHHIVASQTNLITNSQATVNIQIDDTVKSTAESEISQSNVSTNFPAGIDFLCVQEVFDQRAGHTLVNTLHKYYPYIVYDVGKYSWRSNYFIMNSGLLFASRYKLLDVEFRRFGHCALEDVFAAKGLLMLKVQVCSVMKAGVQRNIVGYIANTHLQSEHREHDVRNCQLTEVHDWLEAFRNSSRQSHDIIAFDILCGDFNFDNMSEMSSVHWDHRLLLLYKDPCSLEPGVDQPWTVGTELVQKKLHSKYMKTPEAMKSVLDDESRRHKYVESTKPVGEDTQDGKRRIDFTLYNRNYPLNIEDYRFVTCLANLTDHIPITMTFRPVQNSEDWM